MRAATDSNDATAMRNFISIHAAHAGCDFQCQIRYRRKVNFNPRSPCGLRLFLLCSSVNFLYFNPRSPCGLRLKLSMVIVPSSLFQSTQPMRAATSLEVSTSYATKISIHAAHAGCDIIAVYIILTIIISIHAAHAGCDSGQTDMYDAL